MHEVLAQSHTTAAHRSSKKDHLRGYASGSDKVGGDRADAEWQNCLTLRHLLRCLESEWIWRLI